MKNLAPLALALSLLAPAAVQAATTEENVAVRVSHADLDLAQPQGASVMLSRLERGALSACGASTFSARDVQNEVRGSTCYRQSLDRAVASLAAPGVTSLYRARAQ